MSEVAIKTGSDKTVFGFWVYIMTDCVLFASLFATFIVLRGTMSSDDIFSLPYVLAETLLLLTSSLTCGLGLLAAYQRNKPRVLALFALTFVLGAAFLGLELAEFNKLIAEGNGPDTSAFFSSFFTLVGTHGLHITAGLIWMFFLMLRLWRKGFEPFTLKRIALLSLFWHFLDIVWIFIFSIVYMIGAL